MNLILVFIDFEYLEIYSLLINYIICKNILEFILCSNMYLYFINDLMNLYFKNLDCFNVFKIL